eukprot:4428513-Pyramimonas_sp.AAC.1
MRGAAGPGTRSLDLGTLKTLRTPSPSPGTPFSSVTFPGCLRSPRGLADPAAPSYFYAVLLIS